MLIINLEAKKKIVLCYSFVLSKNVQLYTLVFLF
jgi:hypothetical protein